MKLFNAGQIRQWDEFTMQHEPITSINLMERAALQCTSWIIANNLLEHPVRIFCGKGNNGGDGLAIARQLLERDVAVEVYILEFGNKGTDDFQFNLTRLHRITKQIHFIQSKDTFPVISPDDLVIDALFGSGLNRKLEGLSAQLVEHINKANATILSIDIPSGMFLDTSSKGNVIIKAAYTLSFQRLKCCLLAAENSAWFGKVQVLDIGLDDRFADNVHVSMHLTSLEDMRSIYQPRAPFSHKGNHGHALVIGGANGKAGAAIIATESCMRSGAGLTTVHLLSGDHVAVNTRCPEAMTLAGDELVKKNLPRYNAIAIGPGLGTDDIAHHLVSMLTEHYKGKLVMDADALNVLAQNKKWLQELPPGTILTPHPKEFDRLFGEHDNEFERWQACIAKSKELDLVIVLKGHHSLVADHGIGYFNTTGNAGLAKGGSGDALTGIIAGLLAQGYTSSLAARLGVFLHGMAADMALVSESHESLIASDVVDYLGIAFKKLSNVS